jgi:Concanavalin A-like lectin/glucanases superfamily
MDPQPLAKSANDMLSQSAQTVSDTFNSAKDKISESFNEFSTQPNAPSEFSFSNTIVAKFAFLLLVIILFMFFINLGINLIAYMTSPGNNPFLVKGLRSGTNPLIIPQDPNSNGSVTLLRSNNQSHGAEFTWSIWLFIDDLSQTPKTYQHIFNKGDTNYDPNTGITAVNNAPGLYLGNGGNDSAMPRNSLHIVMDTVGNINKPLSGVAAITPAPETIDVPNVPLKKWFHVAIRLENSLLDVYINGTIDQRQTLNNVPKQNYYSVNVCQNNGFQGNISDLRYFSSALNVFQINTIVSKGPNLNTNDQYTSNVRMKDYHYLSNMWYQI